MKKNELHPMDKMASSELRRTRSYNAKHEARDEKGRFAKGMKTPSENRMASGKNTMPEMNADNCKCTPTLGSSYADEKYREEHVWDKNRDSGKHPGDKLDKPGRGNKNNNSSKDDDDPNDMITIQSYL